MTLLLPGNPVDDFNIQQKFDAIALAWQDNRLQTTLVAAAATADVVVPSTDGVALIEFDLETSAYCELHLFPNNLATAIYSYIHDGSYMAAAAVAVAAVGVANDVNGIRLALPPNAGAAGGTQMTGRATFGLRVPTAADRTCVCQTAVSSLIGAGGHLIQVQNIASKMASNAAITSLRFAVSAGTMTGRIRVTRG